MHSLTHALTHTHSLSHTPTPRTHTCTLTHPPLAHTCTLTPPPLAHTHILSRATELYWGNKDNNNSVWDPGSTIPQIRITWFRILWHRSVADGTITVTAHHAPCSVHTQAAHTDPLLVESQPWGGCWWKEGVLEGKMWMREDHHASKKDLLLYLWNRLLYFWNMYVICVLPSCSLYV